MADENKTPANPETPRDVPSAGGDTGRLIQLIIETAVAFQRQTVFTSDAVLEMMRHHMGIVAPSPRATFPRTDQDGGMDASRRPITGIARGQTVFEDYLVCLECGRKFKTLRRHLKQAHGLTTFQYIEKYDLPADYPIVANSYKESRREMMEKQIEKNGPIRKSAAEVEKERNRAKAKKPSLRR